MATETEVKARLTLDAKQAKSQARSYQQSLQGLQQKIRGTQSTTTGLIKQTIALGTAYLGISAGVRVFKSLSVSAIKYTADLEKTKIGLTSVLTAVNEVPWEQGVKQAEEAFRILKEMSITSPAGPQDMFNIFQGIVGPLRAAGTEMDRIYQITNDTVLASSALGVDFEQAQRDISLMARGAAGMDTKLFSLLRSTGAIAESTEDWNRGLTETERVAKLEAALKKFAGSGDAFGNSWAGLTSTFKGIVDELKRAGATPVMQALQSHLKSFNNTLIENRDHLESLFEMYGRQVAHWINVAAESSIAGFKYLQDNWGAITARFDQAMSVLKRYGPMLAKLTAAYAGAQALRGPAASAVGVAGAMAPGLMAAGGAAKGMWAAAMGTAGSTVGSGLFGSAAAAGGGAGAAGGAAAASIALGPIVAVLAALAAVAVAVKANWDPLVSFMSGPLSTLGNDLMGLLQDTWGALQPLLEIAGTLILAVVVPAFMGLVGTLKAAISILRPFLQILGAIFSLFSRLVQEAFASFLNWLTRLGETMAPLNDIFSGVIEGLGSVASAFGGFISNLLAQLNQAQDDERARRLAAQEGDPFSKDYDAARIANQAMAMTMAANAETLREPSGAKSKKNVPSGRGGSTVNVQKMIIKQDFKNADPARIVTQMIGDITRQAENRVQTRFQGALTR